MPLNQSLWTEFEVVLHGRSVLYDNLVIKYWSRVYKYHCEYESKVYLMK